MQASVEGGESPADILIEHLGVRQSELSRLVAEARAAYDPDNELRAAAERAAAAAAKEDWPPRNTESESGTGSRGERPPSRATRIGTGA